MIIQTPILVCLAMALLLSTQAQAAKQTFSVADIRALAGNGEFKPYCGNPIISPGPKGEWDAGAIGSMSVVKVGKVFHLYYEAWGVRGDASADYSSLQIGHATSLDGIHWTKDPANPVIRKGDAWDKDGTWDPFVIHENGIFKMWYGGGMDSRCDWGYAFSKDGAHFTKKGRISRLGNVEDDHVVRDPSSGKYWMYYWDRAHEPMGLFRAISANETDFDFAHAVNIKIEGEDYPGMYKFTHVFRDGGVWYMLYSNFVRPTCPNSTVRLATSTDGLHWVSRHKNLVTGQDGEILKIAGDLYLVYYGPQNHFDAANCDVRVAVFRGKPADLK